MKQASFLTLAMLLVNTTAFGTYPYWHYYMNDVCYYASTFSTLTVPNGYNGVIVQMLPIKRTHGTLPYNVSCTFEVHAPKFLNLFVAIESLSLRQELDGNCTDYIKLSANGEETEPSCGNVFYSGDVLVKPGKLKPRNEGFHMAHMFQDTSNGVIKVHMSLGPEQKSGSNVIVPQMKLVFTAFEGCIPDNRLDWKKCNGYDIVCINENVKCRRGINCGRGYYNFGNECRSLPGNGGKSSLNELGIRFDGSRILSIKFIFVCGLILYLLLCFVYFTWRQTLSHKDIMSHRRLYQSPQARLQQSRPQAEGAPPDDVIVVTETDLMTSRGSARIEPSPSHHDPPPSYAQVHGSNPPPPYESLFPDMCSRRNS